MKASGRMQQADKKIFGNGSSFIILRGQANRYKPAAGLQT